MICSFWKKNRKLIIFRSSKGIPWLFILASEKNTFITLYILLVCIQYHTVTIWARKPKKMKCFGFFLIFLFSTFVKVSKIIVICNKFVKYKGKVLFFCTSNEIDEMKWWGVMKCDESLYNKKLQIMLGLSSLTHLVLLLLALPFHAN